MAAERTASGPTGSSTTEQSGRDAFRKLGPLFSQAYPQRCERPTARRLEHVNATKATPRRTARTYRIDTSAPFGRVSKQAQSPIRAHDPVQAAFPSRRPS